jgi:hypothetical protein
VPEPATKTLSQRREPNGTRPSAALRIDSWRSIVMAALPLVQEALMTEDEKQREHLGSDDTPASNPPGPIPTRANSPYFKATSANEAAARILRQRADPSVITPSLAAAAPDTSDRITWRTRLKGLWFAISVFVMAQTSQAEPPPPTETTQSEVNAQTSNQTNPKIDYKYSAEQLQFAPSAPQFNFGHSTFWLNTARTLDQQQPEQIVQIIVNVQTEKPSEAEIKDATDYIRTFQHDLHKKVVDPEYLADKVVDGGEALLGLALFKARKKIRANTHNRLVIWLCDTFDRISEAFKEADDNEPLSPQAKKRPIGFLADRINCSSEHTVAILKLTPCIETERGEWEYRESS